MKRRIGILDLGMGNLGNVRRALAYLGYESIWVEDPKALETLDILIFPGVGAFPRARERLLSQGLWAPLQGWLQENRPYLGICLGYQLLFEYGEEWGGAEGLGFFPGTVSRLPDRTEKNEPLKIPHIGWNRLHPSTPESFPYLSQEYAYFVHSYAPPQQFPCEESTITHYGRPFASAARKGKVVGVQFHPERSGPVGLKFLEIVLRELFHA